MAIASTLVIIQLRISHTAPAQISEGPWNLEITPDWVIESTPSGRRATITCGIEGFRELNTPFFKDQTIERIMQDSGT